MTSFFDFSAIDDFDDHIRRSIPNLSSLYTMCHRLTYALAQENTNVVDLGCSTGKFLRETEKKRSVHYVGVDRERMGSDISTFTFEHTDIVDFARSGGLMCSSVVLSLFTLQFLPYRERITIMRSVGKGLVSGGAMILAEKVYLPEPHIDNLVERSLLQWKRGNFSDKSILDKSNRLFASMRLTTQTDMLSMMSETVGPPSIIWAYGAFICAVAVKN